NVVINETSKLFEITDKKNYYAPAFTANKVTYSRSNTKGFNTVCLPFAINVANKASLFGGDSKVYVLKNASTETDIDITFEEKTDGTIAAGTPFLVHNTNDGVVWNIDLEAATEVNSKAGEATASITNLTGSVKLVGSYVKENLGAVDGLYKLNSAGTGFVRTASNSTITPFRFYLDMRGKGSANAIRFSILKSSGHEILVEDAPKGDINGDKMVTLVDLTALVDMVKGTVPQTAAADVNSDGKVNQADIDAIVQIIQNTN
ncbi:MAG: dockerin type I repeat-containing protein, partial [Bacteroidaceae bacterium]|nr:dockerin type I repeat-containing protein [Bacteroidaceae bacterium]